MSLTLDLIPASTVTRFHCFHHCIVTYWSSIIAVYRLSSSFQTSLILVLIITSKPPIKTCQLTFLFCKPSNIRSSDILVTETNPRVISLATGKSSYIYEGSQLTRKSVCLSPLSSKRKKVPSEKSCLQWGKDRQEGLGRLVARNTRSCQHRGPWEQHAG